MMALGRGLCHATISTVDSPDTAQLTTASPSFTPATNLALVNFELTGVVHQACERCSLEHRRKMNGTHDRLVEKVQTLSDLELAVLVCIVAEQHCIVQTEVQLIESVEEELKLVCNRPE